MTIDTSPFSEEIIGFNGPTPVEIDVVKGRISEIRILPNSETPSFIRRIKESGFLSRLNGKTLQEARDTKLDAVSGATYSSEALIRNIELGIEEAITPGINSPKVLTEATVSQGKVLYV